MTAPVKDFTFTVEWGSNSRQIKACAGMDLIPLANAVMRHNRTPRDPVYQIMNSRAKVPHGYENEKQTPLKFTALRCASSYKPYKDPTDKCSVIISPEVENP